MIYKLKLLIAMSLPLFVEAQVVNLDNNIQLVASKNIAIVIDNGGMKNNAVFIPDSSTVYFSGGAGNSLSGSSSTNFFNLTYKGSGTKYNEGTANVYNTLAAENTTTLDADGVGNNKTLTIKSVALSTANVAIIPANADIVGNVTVERYIHTPRKWQLLAVPTASIQTIRQAWQENGTAPAGYGTAITGPSGTNLDFASPLFSMKYVNSGGTDFTMINNTGDAIASQKDGAYYIYVRGDRTNLTANQNNNTTLRTIGPLNVHNFTPSISIPSNTYKSVGNPYASAVHFYKILGHSNIDPEYQLWDPKMPGYYTAGGFVAFSSSTYHPYDPVPLIPGTEFQNLSFPSGVANTRIESGQGFYVFKTNASGSISFQETDKGDSSRNVNRGGSELSREPVAGRSQFNASFYGVLNGAAVIVDGNSAVFGAEFSDSYDERDVDKMTNGSDNFGIDDKQSHELIIDTRPPVAENDTIHYAMYDPFYEQYKIKFSTQNFSTVLQAWLVDKHTQTHTPIGLLGDTTEYSFTVNGQASSYAPDRFKVVFKKVSVVPVRFISINAQRNTDRSITVSWNIANEQNVDHYEVERSATSNGFNEIGETDATNSSQYSKIDNNPLSGDNYYRVRAVDASGEFLYSGIVKVGPEKGLPKIVVVNPVRDKSIQVRLENQQPGKFQAQVFNELGQLVHSEDMMIQSVAELKTIALGRQIAAGAYQLSIRNANSTLMHTQTLIIE